MRCCLKIYTIYIDLVNKLVYGKKYNNYNKYDIQDENELESFVNPHIIHPFQQETKVLFY